MVDLNEQRINAWNSSILPIFEPGLNDLVKVARDGTDGRTPNLHFSTDVTRAVQRADIIFISVNTPTKTGGIGAGSASDLGYVELAARMIAEISTTDKIIVEKSTVPCGTADRLRSIFKALKPGVTFDILSNPEFLAEGTAVNDLLQPDRVLIGSHVDERSKAARDSLAAVYSWVPQERIIDMNIWSSELAKLAANCMLAQRISSINALSAICEATGADISEVSNAIGLDSRIGSRMLKASAGFGGSCFKKDVLSLVYIAESLHLREVAQYWRGVNDMNEHQKTRFSQRITAALHNTLLRKKVTILGWAYKKNTGDTRESAAISIAGHLLAEGAQLAIYDPQVSSEQILRDLEIPGKAVQDRVVIHKDACEACIDTNAIVILTEWDEFKTDTLYLEDRPEDSPPFNGNGTAASSDSGIDMAGDSYDSAVLANESVASPYRPTNRVDWERIAMVVRRPRLVFDGRNIVEAKKLASLGFIVESVGKAHDL